MQCNPSKALGGIDQNSESLCQELMAVNLATICKDDKRCNYTTILIKEGLFLRCRGRGVSGGRNEQTSIFRVPDCSTSAHFSLRYHSTEG